MPQSVQAGTVTYDGGVGGTGTMLDTAADWTGDVIPVTTDEALLDNSVITLPAALTLSSAQTFGDLIINSTTLGTVSLTGTVSQNITLSGGGGSTAAAGAGGAMGDLLLLGSGVTSGTVTVGGGSGTGKLGLALVADGNFDVVNSGATLAVSGIVSGAFNLNKTGAGTLTLSGVNTFGSGKTLTIKSGTVAGSVAAAFGTGSITLGDASGTRTPHCPARVL